MPLWIEGWYEIDGEEITGEDLADEFEATEWAVRRRWELEDDLDIAKWEVFIRVHFCEGETDCPCPPPLLIARNRTLLYPPSVSFPRRE